MLFERQSRIVLVLEQIVQVQTKTKKHANIHIRTDFDTKILMRVVYAFLEGLEDTHIKGTFPPGLHTCAQEPALVLSDRPEGEQIEHGLHRRPIDVGLDSLPQKGIG